MMLETDDNKRRKYVLQCFLVIHRRFLGGEIRRHQPQSFIMASLPLALSLATAEKASTTATEEAAAAAAEGVAAAAGAVERTYHRERLPESPFQELDFDGSSVTLEQRAAEAAATTAVVEATTVSATATAATAALDDQQNTESGREAGEGVSQSLCQSFLQPLESTDLSSSFLFSASPVGEARVPSRRLPKATPPVNRSDFDEFNYSPQPSKARRIHSFSRLPRSGDSSQSSSECTLYGAFTEYGTSPCERDLSLSIPVKASPPENQQATLAHKMVLTVKAPECTAFFSFELLTWLHLKDNEDALLMLGDIWKL